jgi:predicted ATPase
MSPQKQKQRTIEVVVEGLVALAKSNPVLIVFEDVHWIDPTTLEALDNLIAAVPQTRVFMLITFRPEFTPQWGSHSHISAHTLNRLGRRVSSTLVSKAASDKPLPFELTDHIVAKTDGVPLFIEELTKAVIESEIVVDRGDSYALSGAIEAMAIPDTLHDSLMARLDRLIPVKEVAQIGAAIGREFNYQLVVVLSPMSQSDLDAALEKLVASELVFRRGTPPEVTYTFKHALVQDAAYDSMLKRDRQSLHKEIAEALIENFPAIAETEPELLAHHYTEAGLAEMAAPYWLSSGQKAIAGTALFEAVEHLKRGLSEATSVPESAARDQVELEIRSAMGTAYVALKGWAAPEVEATLAPAVSLSNRLNDYELRLQVLWWLWLYQVCLNEFDLALERIEQMFEIETKTGRSDALVVGHAASCATKHWMGDFDGARQHGDEVIRLYDFDAHKHVVQWANHDPKCFVLAWSTHWRWMLGYPDQAAAASDEQLQLARRLKQPFNLGFSLTTGSGAYLHRLEPETALERIAEAVTISRDQSIPLLEIFLANFFGSEAMLQTGRPEKAYEQMKAALDIWHAWNGWTATTMGMVISAKALADLGRHEEALSTIDSCLSLGASKGERWYEAENHRIKGLILLTKTEPEEAAAEASLKNALDVARRQNAKSWELRAATSLARLWQGQCKTKEAHDLLAPVYDWFTEGFDTADLKDAKALLAELK